MGQKHSSGHYYPMMNVANASNYNICVMIDCDRSKVAQKAKEISDNLGLAAGSGVISDCNIGRKNTVQRGRKSVRFTRIIPGQVLPFKLAADVYATAVGQKSQKKQRKSKQPKTKQPKNGQSQKRSSQRV
ncbi:hypothetical protein L596_021443 [Steinernema carpocapsae]|uniref:Uncharacterized protein n=1 Tax=Steinernema carpocapsae TaxID=34508 RepID=A0A4U5MJ51_STECR|nr:hypothetical protein L596_021443 [Steinernema carpocapsae]